MSLSNNQSKQHLENITFIQCLKFYSKKQETEFGRKKGRVRLQLKGDIIHITGIQDNTINLEILCHYQNKFKLVRNQVLEGIGNVVGINFTTIVSDDPQTESEILGDKISRKILKFQGIQEVGNSILGFAEVLKRKFIAQQDFHCLFKVIQKIGKGNFASVFSAKNLLNWNEVAIKSFKKSTYFNKDEGRGKLSFLKEFKILTEISHPNICKFQGLYETENSIYITMDLLSFSLADFLKRTVQISLVMIQNILKDILSALQYLHSKGIMHRDLKMQNIMIKKLQDGRFTCSLIDFGLAEYQNSNQYLFVKCGSPGYVAPQILDNSVDRYTTSCDIFSAGVVLHILLFRSYLFQGVDIKSVLRQNKQCLINFNHERYRKLGKEKQLLKGMLQKDPTKRITAEQALNHPFFSQIL